MVAHSPSWCRFSTYGTLEHGALTSASKLRSCWTVLRCGGRGRRCVVVRRTAHCAAFAPRAHAPCLARYRSDLFLDSASHRANVELVSEARFWLLIYSGYSLSSTTYLIMSSYIDEVSLAQSMHVLLICLKWKICSHFIAKKKHNNVIIVSDLKWRADSAITNN